MMSLIDDNSADHPAEPQSSSPRPEASASSVVESTAAPQHVVLGGDPISLAASVPGSLDPARAALPEDLRISWSWPHFCVFFVFVILAFLAIEMGITVYYLSQRHTPSQKDFETFVMSRPQLAVGSMVLLYGLVVIFLYVSLAALKGFPFWKTLGWRSLAVRDGRKPLGPWLYFVSGCVLSLLVLLATAKIQPPEDVPIEQLFHYKGTAILFVVMAVLVAPVTEETVFRGYLYPLLAKTFGVTTSVIVTGTLFGLLHGAQLGWTWALVSVLIVVGVIFTLVRARTGSVFASFLLHLGYNSMIAVLMIVGTKGFTQMPPR